MCTYPISNLMIFKAYCACIKEVDRALLSTRTAVVLVKILLDDVFEFFPVGIFFGLLGLDLVPPAWSEL